MFEWHNSGKIMFIGLVTEGFFYGLYSGIFAMYLKIQASKKHSNRLQNIIFYSICALYVLSVAVFVFEITIGIYYVLAKPMDLIVPIVFVQTTVFGFCDFVAQFILIYRCWIVWGCKCRVVVIPTLLALAFFGTWLANASSEHISSQEVIVPRWRASLLPTSLVLSLVVNALVMGLILFRIFKVFRASKATSDNKILGATGGNELRSIILVLIESGMAFFSIQFAQLAVIIVQGETESAFRALIVINSIYGMINGITPTIILVRTSMGLSFHDEKSMEEVVIGSLRCASSHLNSVPEMGSIGMVGQVLEDGSDDDFIEVRRSNDIEVVDR